MAFTTTLINAARIEHLTLVGVRVTVRERFRIWVLKWAYKQKSPVISCGFDSCRELKKHFCLSLEKDAHRWRANTAINTQQ